MNKITKTFQYGDHQVTIETGQIARQASGSVMIRMGDTVVLVAVVAKKEASVDRGFFPLTVNYQEKTYAVGKIPGGYFKREGRPTERETLTCRLIDRPIRPLFPKGFRNDVQIVATVISMDPEIDSDIPALIGASAALSLSGAPFQGPIAAARVGYCDGNYLLNPTASQLETSDLDLVVAGTEQAVLMVESEADGLSEEVMLGAVMFGHQQMQVVITAIHELVAEAGTEAWDWTPPETDHDLQQKISDFATEQLQNAYQIKEKLQRQDAIKVVAQNACDALCGEDEESAISEDKVKAMLHDLESKIVREQVLSTGERIDGRDLTTVRPIAIEVGVLPRTHGSAVFTRGETQAIVVSTLGTARDSQIIDSLTGEYREGFMLHYNFPHYCVGETGMMTGPKRREIGHGRLAKRAIQAVIPQEEDNPYVLRVVSEITESNGSSSMATVCGTSLSLMDAGVAIKAPVAGIAMGLIKEDDRVAVLTDILGDEDHLGDMDFKVAGTAEGITALQMDIKINGITEEIMHRALEQAKQGRLHILNCMNEVLAEPRQDISDFAPRITTIQINPDKIRDVIGKGGATIRELTESTNTTIDITDDGVIKIAAVDGDCAKAAEQRIRDIVAEPEVGITYDGKVMKITDYGAFVEIIPGTQGLVHVSQICNERVDNVRDKLSEGQQIRVKLIEIDNKGRLRLSMKDAEHDTEQEEKDTVDQ